MSMEYKGGRSISLEEVNSRLTGYERNLIDREYKD